MRFVKHALGYAGGEFWNWKRKVLSQWDTSSNCDAPIDLYPIVDIVDYI